MSNRQRTLDGDSFEEPDTVDIDATVRIEIPEAKLERRADVVGKAIIDQINSGDYTLQDYEEQ